MISEKAYKLFYFLTGTLILMIPVLSNNYPFVYSDTGTYIVSGFENFIPKDRPIFYGWFIRHLSLSLTFWIPIIIQSFFTFMVIHVFCKYYLNIVQKRVFTLAITLLLVSSTGIGLFTGKLMPDIFSGLIIVAGFLLFFRRDLNKWEKRIVGFIFYYGLMVHLSNMILILVFLLIFSAYHFYKSRFKIKTFLNILMPKRFFISLSLLAIFTVFLVNLIYENKFQLTKTSHVFMMGKMSESGILKRYLDCNCDENKYELCNYKDNLPSTATGFIWPHEGVMNKTGGWINSENEYDKILFDIYITPKYWKWLASDYIMSTLRQFFTFSPGIIEPHLDTSPPHVAIDWKMPHEMNSYLTSKQQLNDFPIKDIERRQNLLVYFSLAIFCFVLFELKNSTSKIIIAKKEILFLLTFLLLNAFVCGALANVIDRLQGRVIWILPLAALIISINYLSSLKLTISHNERV